MQDRDPSEPSAPPAPIPYGERLHALDAMRGVAILGVLFAYTIWNLGAPPEQTWGRADHLVSRGADLLVDDKFLTMFACLFGVGVAQQWRRWEAAGSDPLPLHLRRMGFLLAVGLLHAVFVRNGDILAPYALLGLLLPAFRRAPGRVLAIVGVVLVLAPYGVQPLWRSAGIPWPARPVDAGGGYLAENLAWLRHWYLTNPLVSWPRVLALMLAGLVIGRAGLLERLAVDRARTLRLFAVALALAVVTRLAFDRLAGLWAPEVRDLAQRAMLNLVHRLSAWTLAATYGAGLLLLAHGPSGEARLAPLRAIGRMAFTNYLLQGLLVVPLCLAFGLFDTMAPVRALWLALAITVAQALFSAWWLARHPMGPLERVWRSVTYGTRR